MEGFKRSRVRGFKKWWIIKGKGTKRISNIEVLSPKLRSGAQKQGQAAVGRGSGNSFGSDPEY